MGQAWCKEKSTKAQDSKSPLDRVFVRCAHRIYPSLKEEGSVLGGGATQRVTSSEIGYAASAAPPPRAGLLRVQSIDSVDRPFHPSEWVDVNLEVPCEPRASVLLAGINQQLRNSRLLLENGEAKLKSLPTAEEKPVPPPRRRRRREQRRSLVVDAADADSSATAIDDVDDFDDSDLEFVEIERSLGKLSLEELPGPSGEKSAKRHEDDAVDQSKVENEEANPTAVAKRPPRQVKSGSLPRELPVQPPTSCQPSPERTLPPNRRRQRSNTSVEPNVEDSASSEGCCCFGDNSICKIDTSEQSADGFERRTSTPVKAAIDEADARLQSLDDAFDSFKDASNESHDSSSRKAGPSAPALVAHDVDRPPPQIEDAGYESRSSAGQMSTDRTNSQAEIFHEAQDASSGILADAIVNSGDSRRLENPRDGNVPELNVMQRTISEESLPREMLVEELEDFEELSLPSEEKSAKEITSSSANELENFKTPPPSPQMKIRKISNGIVNGFDDDSKEQELGEPQSCPEKAITTVNVSDDGNPTSMTPSLMELGVALTDMLERKDIEEDEEEEEENKTESQSSKPQDKSSDKTVEPQIVPVKQIRPFKDVDDILDEQQQQQQQSRSRLIDLPMVDGTNLFGDFKSDDSEPVPEEPPEKPKRLERVSLPEDPVIQEPVIVPTPPRRRNRSKSNLSSVAEPEALHTFASRDRLI